jgi:hypothetical protein
VTYQTKEWVKGSYVSVYARFRKYPSFAESIIDHDNFIKSVKLANGLQRYAAVLSAATPAAACQALQKCGYATSPTYPKTLTNIISNYNLTQYDVVLDPSACPYTEPTVTYKNGVTFRGNDARWYEWQLLRIGYKPADIGCTTGLDAHGTDGIAESKVWHCLNFEQGCSGNSAGDLTKAIRDYLKSVASR